MAKRKTRGSSRLNFARKRSGDMGILRKARPGLMNRSYRKRRARANWLKW